MAQESMRMDETLAALVMRPRAVQRTYDAVAVQAAGAAPNRATEALAVAPAAAQEATDK